MHMTETSSSSESALPPKKRMRPFNNAPGNALEAAAVLTTKNKKTKVALSKYKGASQLPNGHWGCQVYDDNKRHWLGTYKSDVEAAMAYDSASIKTTKPHRNIPVTDITKHEPEFQKEYTMEAVWNMIRDKSYQDKFKEFVAGKSKKLVVVQDEESNKCIPCTQIFDKKLTLSDVGSLNRLVIPKKYAVKYLPYVRDDQNEREEGEIVEDVEVVFRDRASERQWKFRYSYWRSSQSFVFTRGWNGFVKEKNVKKDDVIVFYTCDEKTSEGQSNKILMIDVFYSKLQEETKKYEKKGGVMIFGVWMQ